jgi:mannose-6-phosphate isomerase
MRELYAQISDTNLTATRTKEEVLDDLVARCRKYGYEVVELLTNKPWGAMARFDTEHANDFIENFFPGLNPHEARLGHDNMELSPKLLLVTPGERLSWQKHHRRAERWAYITKGGYHKSNNPDETGELIEAMPGMVVQFENGECHRLVGLPGDDYTLVAEIWQHTDNEHPSDENDIVRLQDDYKR